MDKAKIENMCGSGNPTDPKFLGPTLTLFIEPGKNIYFPDSKFLVKIFELHILRGDP